MSTVSTSINWGASYLTNDLYLRFFRPEAPQTELVLVGRLASILVTVLGGVAAFFTEDVSTVFRLVIAIGTGPGLVLMLRWFWWRINAAAEWAAMVCGFVIGLITSLNPEALSAIPDFGTRLLVISGITAVVWITVMLVTPPESDETLDAFYCKVRPAGIGWRRQRERTGIAPIQNLKLDSLRVIAATFVLFGAMFSVGGFLLLRSLTGWVWLIIGILAWFWLRKLDQQVIPPMPRPGLEDH